MARWVAEGDCSLFTDRNVGEGYDSVDEGRRACQAEADRTPVEPYRVEATHVDGRDAMVVLALEDDTRYTFWLVAHDERDWRIDGFEERRPGDLALDAAGVIEAFERRTGERLDRIPELSSTSYQTLGFREFVAAARAAAGQEPERFHALIERFGAFNIFVAHSSAEAKRLVGGGRPDRRGIHWRRRKTRWGAEKRYGNVVLSWTGGEAKRTDAGFDLLDSTLTRAVR